jgi:hypothetical protein
VMGPEKPNTPVLHHSITPILFIQSRKERYVKFV